MKDKKQIMSPSTFTRNLRRGLGSAIIELKRNTGIEEYRDIVMKSCLKDIAYDTQVEGTKGYYLYTAIKTFESPEIFLNSIIEKFEKRLYWRLSEQLFEILACFSDDGYVKADEAFEKKYCELKNHLPAMRDKEFSRFCERELLEKLMVRKLNKGFESFKQCVNDMGEMIIKRGNDDCLWYDFFVESAKDIFGNGVYSFLENDKNDNTKIFFQMFNKSNSEENGGLNLKIMTASDFSRVFEYEQDPRKEEKVTIEQLITRATELSLETDSNPYRMRPLSRKFAKQAKKEDLKRLARIAIDEPSDFIKSALLHVFSFVAFPLDIDLLLPYSVSDNDSLREITIKVLSCIKDKRIHAFAIQLFNDMKVENVIKLLEANFEVDDEALIRKHIVHSKRVTHGLIVSITDIFGEHKSNTCGDILLHLYKNAECTHCRYKVVETMINNNVIPEKILIECQHDSYEDTRKLAVESLAKMQCESQM